MLQYLRIPFMLTVLLVSVACSGGSTPDPDPEPTTQVLADFNDDAPAGFFVYNGGASSVTASPQTVTANDELAVPEQAEDNGILQASFAIGDFGGLGQDLNQGLGGPQDWRDFTSMGMWFYGNNSGLVYQLELQDNRSDPASDTAERFDINFNDDFSGWRFLTFPFTDFVRATDFQPGGAPDDGLGLDQVWGWALVLPQGEATFYIDDVSLLGGDITLRVGFERLTYDAAEGATATVSVSLTTAASEEVRVDYATADSTATAGSDYTQAAGTLVFAPGETVQNVNLELLDDAAEEGAETFTLSLSNPSGAILGSNTQATVTIQDDDFSLPDDAVTVDDFETGLPAGSDADGVGIGFLTFQDGNSSVSLATTDAPPEAVPASASGNQVLELALDVSVFAGFVHSFTNDAIDTWETQDWSAYEGFGFWLYGSNSGTDLFVDILDNRAPGSTVDDAERYSVAFKDDFSGWRYIKLPFADFTRKEIGNGAPNDGLGLTDVHGWAFGTLATGGNLNLYIDDVGVYGTAPFRPLAVSFTTSRYDIAEGATDTITVALNREMVDEDADRVTVNYTTEPSVATPEREYQPVSGQLTFVRGGPSEQTFSIATSGDSKFEGDERIVLRLANPQGAEAGIFMQSSAFIVDDDPFDPNVIDDFEQGAFLWEADGASLEALGLSSRDALAAPGQDAFENVLEVTPNAGTDNVTITHDFALGQDWTNADALTFWYYGTGDGREVTVSLKDNRAPDPGPSGWNLVWSDEFDTPAGTPPDPDTWSYEIGDVTPDGKNGWGNDELQYYTDDIDNAATDGQGNLVITTRAADGSLECYYGTCQYTSARLITWHKAEFAYGRIESRIQVPQGAGLWPAFWSLGTDIDVVSWPQTGEIDFMEFVGRLPNEIYGTIHGPGYSGGQSFGNEYDFGMPVYTDYHTFTVEWQPDLIVWYVDGIKYHEAVPADVAPNAWVFNDPVFFILNVAIGGNFGGAVGEDTTFPQSMKVDYVRVFQAPDSAERFETTFTDDTAGWQQISLPLTSFVRSSSQPADAPDDGLGLNEVWGYGLSVDSTAPFYLDRVILQ